MPRYVDGFLVPVPKSKLGAYLRIAKRAGKVWKKYGALEYRECVGDDVNTGMGRPFTKAASIKRGEVVVFSWIVYKSRAHRDRVNARVMTDPYIVKMMKPGAMPFDDKRMSFGGFKVGVDM